MSDLNQCNFIGRLGKNPDVRELNDGNKMVTFSIACGESYKDKEGNKVDNTEWINCVAYRKLADICAQYLHKGKQVYVSGKLKTTKSEKDGQTKYFTNIVLDQMKMLGSKEDGSPQESSKPLPSKTNPLQGEMATKFDEFDSEIPF